jgi:NAD(P)-dependent dehydrogenase (short-subunit alcohol dehydrogenase family)
MAKQFDKKVALVTGGASGIGLATAVAFAREGARVVVADTQEAAERSVADAIRKEDGEFLYHVCDVSHPAQVQGLIARAMETFGRLDFAVNNAGIEGATAFTADGDEANWDRVLGVNLKGAWLCMKHEIPAMLKGGGGCIVNVASIAGIVGFAGSAPYVASKHGLVGITRCAALEYAKQGIRVNAVCPGVIQTPMIDRVVHGNPDMAAYLAGAEPIGRFGTPEEIAAAILFLCSPGAAFVVGHPMVVDGGWVAQ